MKIAVIIHELVAEGGGERQCLSLAQALQRQGHTVTVLTCAYEASKCFPKICKDLSIEVAGRGPLPWLRDPWFVRGYLDMRRLFTRVKRPYDIWNPHHWPAQWAAVWLKRKLGGAVLWNCNDVPNFYLKSKPRSTNFVLASIHRLYYLYDRKQNRDVDITVLVSEWANHEFRSIYPGETRVIGPGLDPAQFRPRGDRARIRKRFGFADEEFVLLWLGILMPHRRLEDALAALGILKSRGIEPKLLLAGSGESHPAYLSALKSHSIRLQVHGQVTFAGKVADAEIRDFYCAADAFLFPNDQQTWGLAVLEAMACGCPVLVSKGTGVHEVLNDFENAVLFLPRNPAALAQKVERLIAEPELRHKVAQNGMEYVHASYTWSRYADAVAKVCMKLLRRENPMSVEFTVAGSSLSIDGTTR